MFSSTTPENQPIERQKIYTEDGNFYHRHGIPFKTKCFPADNCFPERILPLYKILIFKNLSGFIMKTLSLVLRLIVAAILVQTLYFKFTAAPESVYIFQTLGAEPWGRIGSGIAELVAAVLLLIPRTAGIGALISLGIISGAILSHLTLLGIEIQGDNGLLFGLALAIFAGSALIAWLHRQELVSLVKTF